MDICLCGPHRDHTTYPTATTGYNNLYVGSSVPDLTGMPSGQTPGHAV